MGGWPVYQMRGHISDPPEEVRWSGRKGGGQMMSTPAQSILYVWQMTLDNGQLVLIMGPK